ALKKQAKQAERYKSLAALIRRAEAIALTLRWREAETARGNAAERLALTEQLVAEATTRVASATTVLTEITAQLPDLRRAETEAAAKVTRLETQSQALDVEESRVRAALEDLLRRLAQLAEDRNREEARRHDAAGALERLSTERGQIEDAAVAAAEQRREVESRLERQRTHVAEREEAVARATEAVATAEAERAALQRQIAEGERRLADMAARLESSIRDRASLEAVSIPPERRAEAEQLVATAEQALAAAALRIEVAESQRRAVQEEERGARAALGVVEADVAKIDGEVQALQRLLADHGTADMFAPVIDQIRVEPGYEAALGAALGDDLTAPLDSTAPSHWRGAEPADADPALPPGATALADFVHAPAALTRRLRQIGLVDEAIAPALAEQLATGQRLVTRTGGLWRWDGFTVRSGAPSAAAARLAQRNRLAELMPLRNAGLAQMEGARARMNAARQDEATAAHAEQTARIDGRQAQDSLDRTRQTASRLARESAEQAARLVALGERIDRLTQDHAADKTRHVQLGEQHAALPDIAQAREALQADRESLSGERGTLTGLRSDADRMARESESRTHRLSAIDDDATAWTSRAQAAELQITALAERVTSEETERARLESEPASIAERRVKLLELMTIAEADRKSHADTLVDAETRSREAERTLKAEEASLMGEREARVRAEAQAEQTTAHTAAVVALIREKLDCAPEETLAAGGVDPSDELPTLEQIEARVERLTRERDNVGPVNLRAEQEAAELDQQLDAMQSEKNDLLAAIGKLRQGIGSLNREGRERLLAAFEQVNKHFQELFTALFGGGRAHLQLSHPPAEEGEAPSTDPLDAGLEVMASPPGKKLQTLSLLSGGEQALTALALLFAVFLTTPAPICVLDEVDAPLDDANVDRFCKLLDTISGKSSTRFVVVTHHRMTMARMDRLFGVTMAERGVSQLVSVDLAAAERMRATA
ncbi:MAG: chromosome partitioning protein ParA, partial [Alphaproteobacteria bacterium]|nr:chromosome partitioning protein ParA [Alphaproteobacteria bacterium]